MKRQILAVVLGSLFALPALANSEVTNNEIYSGYTPPTQASQHAQVAFVNAEQGYVFTATAADKSRAEVRAEVAQARSTGDYIANAELGTKASQL